MAEVEQPFYGDASFVNGHQDSTFTSEQSPVLPKDHLSQNGTMLALTNTGYRAPSVDVSSDTTESSNAPTDFSSSPWNSSSDAERSSDTIELTDVCRTKHMQQEVNKDLSPLHGELQNNARPNRETAKLTFPPCYVCGAKACGCHYGVISCAACKGFFRRYLLRKEAFTCKKGGKCVISDKPRGQCKGCRLKKCLEVGMSKEKSSIGRYKISKRTETIIEAKNLTDADARDAEDVDDDEEQEKHQKSDMDLDATLDIVCLKLSQCGIGSERPKDYSDDVVMKMVELLGKLRILGSGNIRDEDLPKAFEDAAENHRRKTELFGSMKAVSWTEFAELYKQYGIDIDGRVADLEVLCKEFDGWIYSICGFMKEIPLFCTLPVRDQVNLIKASMNEIDVLISFREYSVEHKLCFILKKVYHEEYVIDKFISKQSFDHCTDCYVKLQKLNPSPTEVALMCALVVFSPGRCKIINPKLVEKIQSLTANRLQYEVRRQHSDSSRRFAKIMDCLVDTRGISDMIHGERKEFYGNEIVQGVFPAFAELIPEGD